MPMISQLEKTEEFTMKIKNFNNYQPKKHNVKILENIFLLFFSSSEISKLY